MALYGVDGMVEIQGLFVPAASGIELQEQEKADKEEREAAAKIQACFRTLSGGFSVCTSLNVDRWLTD